MKLSKFSTPILFLCMNYSKLIHWTCCGRNLIYFFPIFKPNNTMAIIHSHILSPTWWVEAAKILSDYVVAFISYYTPLYCSSQRASLFSSSPSLLASKSTRYTYVVNYTYISFAAAKLASKNNNVRPSLHVHRQLRKKWLPWLTGENRTLLHIC